MTEFRGGMWTVLQPFEWASIGIDGKQSFVWFIPEIGRYVYTDEVEQVSEVSFKTSADAFRAMRNYIDYYLDGKVITAEEKVWMKKKGEEHREWMEDNQALLKYKWRFCDPYTVPLNTEILLRWDDGHVESGMFFETPGEDYPVNYQLWDGDRITSFPIHWMFSPSLVKE